MAQLLPMSTLTCKIFLNSCLVAACSCHLHPFPEHLPEKSASAAQHPPICSSEQMQTDVEFVDHQDVFFCKFAFQSFVTSLYWCLQLFHPTCWTVTLFLLNVVRFLSTPFFFYLVRIPLNCSLAHHHIDCSPQTGSICILGWYLFFPIGTSCKPKFQLSYWAQNEWCISSETTGPCCRLEKLEV